MHLFEQKKSWDIDEVVNPSKKKLFYRPILIGSSAIANSSVAALLPFFFFEYHRNKIHADAFTAKTIHAIYTPYP